MASCGWFPLSYDEIVAWIEQHRDALPTTLDELSALPVAFRRVIVNHVGLNSARDCGRSTCDRFSTRALG